MLIRDAATIWTGEAAVPRLDRASLRVENGRVSAIGDLAPLPGEEIVDAHGCVVAPGWVNTHHHFFQSLLKAVPGGLHKPLAEWSPAVSLKYRGAFDEGTFRIAARVALTELVLSGCTTIADHQFLYWPGMDFDPAAIAFDEAARLGVRLILCRGGMTASADPAARDIPWRRPENVDAIVRDVEELVRRYHDPSEEAFRRIVVAPTTMGNRTTRDDLIVLGEAARRLGLRRHSHLNETGDDNAFCQEKYGRSAVELCDEVGWLAPDAWYAHLVHTTADEIDRLARSGVGLAHCPASNARLAGGIAPVPAMAQAGLRIGLGVDGAASNEAADMLSEMRFAWLLHRASSGNDAPDIATIVRWASAGGADLVGLKVGSLSPGMQADLGIYALDDLAHAGLHDLGACLVISTGRPILRRLFCAGREVVRDGEISGLDLAKLRHDAASAVAQLIEATA